MGYRIKMSYACTIGLVLAAAVRTVKNFFLSPKLWWNIQFRLRTTKGQMLQQHQRRFWKALTYVGGSDAWRNILLALVGLLFTLIYTYIEV